jgi:hypothetical protein
MEPRRPQPPMTRQPRVIAIAHPRLSLAHVTISSGRAAVA